MSKTIEESFIDWESHVFGYGYGTGEQHVLPALKSFFGAFGQGPHDSPRGYGYREIEAAVGATVAWLLLNTLCHAGVLDYGTSPRHGWLTEPGEALRSFMATRSVEQLLEIIHSRTQDSIVCYPDACNCGPNGYEKGRKCPNPFWVCR